MSNGTFGAAFIAWFIAQVLKVILTFISEGRLNIYRMIGSGGMPSSHSSFVMGMSTAVGLIEGWDSSAYAIALVISLIVMYDASGVRRSVGNRRLYLIILLMIFIIINRLHKISLKSLLGILRLKYSQVQYLVL